jgi:hypothetical protein
MSPKTFNLDEENDAIDFQREMYNLASMLESILDKIDVKKCNELAAIKQEASKIESLCGAWKRTNKTWNKGGCMDSILGSEQELRSSDEDVLGVFDSDNVRAALNRMNYQVAYVAFGVCCAPSISSSVLD